MSGSAIVREHGSESHPGSHHALARQLATAREMEALEPGAGSGGGPFSVVLVFDSKPRRDFVRRRLIEQAVSPAVLGPLEDAEGPEEDRQLYGRLLSLDSDAHGNRSDLARAVAIAQEASGAYDARSPGNQGNKAPEPADSRVEAQHDDWPHFISAQSSPVWGHRYGRHGTSRP